MKIEFVVNTNNSSPTIGKGAVESSVVAFSIDADLTSAADLKVLWDMEQFLNTRTASRWHISVPQGTRAMAVASPAAEPSLSHRETRAIQGLLDALTQWPCEESDGKPGGKHYMVDYTVAQARRSWRTVQKFLRVFPQFKVED